MNPGGVRRVGLVTGWGYASAWARFSGLIRASKCGGWRKTMACFVRLRTVGKERKRRVPETVPKLAAYSSDYPVTSTNYHGRLRPPFLSPVVAPWKHGPTTTA